MEKFQEKIATIVLLIGLALVSIAHQGVSQDISRDVLKWSIAVDIDRTIDSTARSYDSYFITSTQNKIDWITLRTDQNGQVSTTKNSLEISKAKGTWRNIKKDGEKEFNVAMNKSAGTLTIKRANGKYNIALNLLGKTGGKLNRVFKISNVEKQ